MESKLIEIRDVGTHIPALATLITKESGYPARRAGYNDNRRFVILTKLTDCESKDDPYKWNSLCGRTMRIIHEYLVTHWDDVIHDGVVDARYILGEIPYPAPSERNG